MSFIILGHRGMGPTKASVDMPKETLPENSLAAFNKAISLGADGIEFDLHRTKDGEVVVIHDDEIKKKVCGFKQDALFAPKPLPYDFSPNLFISELNQDYIQNLNIGNDHTIPTLTDVLDLIVENNSEYKNKTGANLTINIELKGKNTSSATYETISNYINDGRLQTEDFIFNSFHWDRLIELREKDSNLKIMPAIKTKHFFGEENVIMPGFTVPAGTSYKTEAFEKLNKFHEKVSCHAFDCVIFDLRPELIDFCEMNKVGLFTSTSSEYVKAGSIKEPLSLMVEASKRLPFTGFRADHVVETRALLDEIINESVYDALECG